MAVPAAMSRDEHERVPGRFGGLAAPVERPRPARTRRERRGIRGWMLLMLLTPASLGVVIAFALGAAGPPPPPGPSVRPLSVPAGYRAVANPYFGFAVPASYRPNAAWTDSNGDFFYGDPLHGWVAETLLVARRSPTAATRPPVTFRFFAEGRSTPYTLSGGHPVHVAGASFAWELDVHSRAGWRAVALDTWSRRSSTEMWMLVRAPGPVTRAVLASVRG